MEKEVIWKFVVLTGMVVEVSVEVNVKVDWSVTIVSGEKVMVVVVVSAMLITSVGLEIVTVVVVDSTLTSVVGASSLVRVVS